MVKYNRSLDTTFQALADPTRRAILAALMNGQASITDLARPYRMTLPGVMKHLGVLERAGLVTQRKVGRSRRCRLVARPLKDAEVWISRYREFWEGQFDAFERYLAEQPAQEQSPQEPPQGQLQEKQQEKLKWSKRKRRPRQQ
jgi:DNA-binding transcriptional ArsR family regulator